MGNTIESNSKKIYMNNSIEKKSYINNINNTNYNNKFVPNKKIET